MEGEFRQLYEAGLTPFEVLRAATSNGTRFLGTAADTGTIAPGKIADLVPLDADPLDDVTNVLRQDGIMLAGQWFPEDVLQTELSQTIPDSDGGAQRTVSRRSLGIAALHHLPLRQCVTSREAIRNSRPVALRWCGVEYFRKQRVAVGADMSLSVTGSADESTFKHSRSYLRFR